MAYQVWPITLPQNVLANSFAESPPDTLLRTNMDTGPAKIRQRFTAGARSIKGSVTMTAAQVETFDGFYISTLAGGSLPFEFTHPRTRATVVLRFVTKPKYEPVNGSSQHYKINLDLEVLP